MSVSRSADVVLFSASFIVSGLLRTELIGVAFIDPAALAIVVPTLIVLASVGCWLPVRRAMLVDPATTLRQG